VCSPIARLFAEFAVDAQVYTGLVVQLNIIAVMIVFCI